MRLGLDGNARAPINWKNGKKTGGMIAYIGVERKRWGRRGDEGSLTRTRWEGRHVRGEGEGRRPSGRGGGEE